MSRFLTALLLVALALPASGQSLELIGTVELPSMPRPGADEQPDAGVPNIVGGSDVWAYTAPDGAEYALMGDLNGISIVAVPSLEVVAHIDGPTERAPFYWRDIKTYGSFAYVTTEAYGPNEGLQVIDLRGLPHSAELVTAVRGQDDRLVSSHNLSIDTRTGHAWVLNSDGTQIVALDLSNPLLPVEVGAVDVPDSHDVYAYNGTLYVAEGRTPKISVWDVSDPANPVASGSVVFPDPGYVHNVWPTEDGTHILTTEETANKSVKVWNIEDLSNPELVAEWLGESNLAHNVHVQGDLAIISHYSSGLSMVDITDLANPVEVARFDTHPDNDDAAFYGNWGASLPTPSGYVYASDLEGTLTVLKWNPNAVDS
ncbi:MAG TPA: choice-of-anchor B family protein [Bacteroidetes bacterium]|nr:choice-of-anchor B family protein [Bacteroidota bacterium]HIL57322.1 choice-of-anchor B family protein [Rhodothermales bacterium]